MPTLGMNHPICDNIKITVEGVTSLLLRLDPAKATGPDTMSPRILSKNWL